MMDEPYCGFVRAFEGNNRVLVFSSFFHSYFILNAEYDEMTQFVKEKEIEKTRKRIY